jgi:hypothetical protein
MATIIGEEITYAYAADIIKSDPTPDGHLMVHGKAASPTLDLDGQICDPAWLAQEMPDWFRWGNIRAQHGPVAAGVGKSLEADGADGYDLSSLIVDSDSKEKVRTGVYKGYSVGIKGARVVKDAKAPNGRIVGGKIVEISLVDRPCNPDAKMTLVKSVGGMKVFEDPGDPESDVVETEILAPTDADGDVIEPDDVDEGDVDADGEEISELVKGFIEFLRGPKPKKPAKTGRGDDHKRDQGGRFARQQAAMTAREKRVAEREARLKDRQADVARATMDNALSSEALADARHAREQGRTEEAQEHAHEAASHATDRGHRSAARREYTAIGKGAGLDDVVRGWGDTSDEALEYIVYAATRELLKRASPDVLKGILPDAAVSAWTAAAPAPEPAAEPVMEKAAGVDGAQSAIVTPELTKAEARIDSLEASNASLREQLAKVQEMLTKTAAPDANAPVLVRQTTLRPAPVVEPEAARLRREASRMTDPAAQRAFLAYAESLEAGH